MSFGEVFLELILDFAGISTIFEGVMVLQGRIKPSIRWDRAVLFRKSSPKFCF